ncbi:hypothetical protein HY090_02615 [Candidatus Kaiserbacteria bacterium]|nr:hypothetical protein [Candidatus Kaiserbacteria bacterium]
MGLELEAARQEQIRIQLNRLHVQLEQAETPGSITAISEKISLLEAELAELLT